MRSPTCCSAASIRAAGCHASSPSAPKIFPLFDRDATKITYDLWHGYRKLARDGNKAAFPFGFGLTYTSWRHDNLRLASEKLTAAGTLQLSVDVTNTGTVAGDDVVQLYVAAHGSKVERAARELKAFERVTVAPGETRTVSLSVPVSELAYYDERKGWVVEPLEYEALIAHHAEDKSPLSARFRVT